MGHGKIMIARELVEQAMATGGDPRKFLTTTGLPPGARLVSARLVELTGPVQQLELVFEHESFAVGEATIVLPLTVEVVPNRFLYYFVVAWGLNGQAGNTGQTLMLTAPLDDPSKIKHVADMIAAQIKMQGPNGGALIGAKATCCVLNWSLLRAWYDATPIEQAAGGGQREQPEAPLSMEH